MNPSTHELRLEDGYVLAKFTPASPRSARQKAQDMAKRNPGTKIQCWQNGQLDFDILVTVEIKFYEPTATI